MSFDVNLGFKVTTDGLNETVAAIDKLTTAVGKFNKAEIDAARVSTAKSKADKAKEDANKAAAKALEAEIVLTDKNNTLQDKAAKKAAATAVAQTNVAQATTTSTNALDRQKDVLAYMTEGFSRGQASTLAYAKATGLAADQLKELGQVLQTQRKLIGGDPFDKSTSGLLSLQTQYKETQVAIAQYNAQTGLTRQQTRELSRDYERLTTQMLSQGRSMGDITSALDQHTQKYIAVATELNRLTTAEKAHERALRDAANASRSVSKEEERMISIMNSLNNTTNANASFSEKAAIAEANYARNLRLAGVSADDAAKRLGIYRQQQILVAAEEEKRQAKFLQRGLQPQIGDTVVSLAGGQNPLTVLLQQGDQIRGLIAQSGLQGEALAASMRAAFTGTIESIKMTAVAMSSVLGGAIVGVGKILTDVVMGPIRGFRQGMAEAAAAGSTGMLKFSSIMKAAFSATNTAALAALPLLLGSAAIAAGLLAFAFIKVSKEEDVLTETLLRNGGSLGLNKSAALELARSFDAVGVSTAKAVEFITAFAKEGGFTKSEIESIIPVASEMQRVFGDSAEEIVKQFAKIKKDPVDALLELAAQYGNLNVETIRLVEEQLRLGNTLGATAIAMNEGKRINQEAVNSMKQDYSTLGSVINQAGNFFSKFWQEVKGLVYTPNGLEILEKRLSGLKSQLADAKSNVSFLGSMGKNDLVDSLNLQVQGIERAIAAQKANNVAVEQSTATQSRQAVALKTINSEYEKILTPLEKYNKAAAKYGELIRDSADETARSKSIKLLANAQKEYNDALDKANKPSKEARASAKQAIKDEEVYGNLIAKSVNFTATYAEEVQALNRYAKDANLTQDKYNQAYFALLEKQPYFINLKKEEAAEIKATSDALELEARLLGKADDLGKDYYTSLVKIGEAHANGFPVDRILKMIAALNEATPAAKKLSKAWEDVGNDVAKKYEDSITKSNELTDSVIKESEALVFQASIIGKTDEERKKSIKTKQAQLELDKELRDIEKLDRDTYGSQPDVINARKLEAQKRFADKVKNINTELAVDAATKYNDEMQKMANDLGDILATTLFDGGKAGAKKLRDYVVNLFKQKITVAIQGEIAGMMGLPSGANAASSFLSGGSTIGSAANAMSGVSLAGTVASLTSTVGNFTAGLSAGFSQFTAGVNTFASVANGAAVGGSTGLGISIGAAGPYIAAALALYALYKGTQGETRNGGQYGYGQTDTGNYGNLNSQFIQGPSGGQIQQTAVQSAIDSTVTGINNVLKKLGSSATLVGFQAALESSGNGRGGVYAGGTLSTGAKFGEAGLGGGRSNYNGTLYETTSANTLDSETALKNFSTDLIQATLQAIQAAADIPKSISAMLAGVDVEALSQESATALLNSVIAMSEFTAALKTLPFANLQDLSYEASVALSDLMGGLGGLSSALSSYYNNFYTESERQKATLKSVEDTFKSLGLTMPDLSSGSDNARAEFRKLVEAQDLSTESGRKNYATLLQMSGTFAELTPLLDDAKNAWKDLTQSILEEVQRIRGVINSGENQSLSSAQAAFDLATTLARAGDKDAAASLPELSKTLLDIAAKQATSLTELRRIQYITAGSLEQTATVIPKFAAGGDYSGGLALVGEKGPELINFSSGGYVANASNTANLLDNNSVLDLLDKVNTNLDGMRYELRSNVTHVAKTAKLLDRVIPDGASVQVTVVNP